MSGREITHVEIRKRLLAAGRHLSAAQFGNAVSKCATPGIAWSGSSKGDVCEGVSSILIGDPPNWMKFRQRPEFTLEDVEAELRAWKQPRRFSPPAARAGSAESEAGA